MSLGSLKPPFLGSHHLVAEGLMAFSQDLGFKNLVAPPSGRATSGRLVHVLLVQFELLAVHHCFHSPACQNRCALVGPPSLPLTGMKSKGRNPEGGSQCGGPPHKVVVVPVTAGLWDCGSGFWA